MLALAGIGTTCLDANGTNASLASTHKKNNLSENRISHYYGHRYFTGGCRVLSVALCIPPCAAKISVARLYGSSLQAVLITAWQTETGVRSVTVETGGAEITPWNLKALHLQILNPGAPTVYRHSRYCVQVCIARPAVSA